MFLKKTTVTSFATELLLYLIQLPFCTFYVLKFHTAFAMYFKKKKIDIHKILLSFTQPFCMSVFTR